MVGLEKNPMQKSVKRKKVVFRRFGSYMLADGSTVLGGTGGENTPLYSRGTLCAKRMENCDASESGLRQGVGLDVATTSANNTVRGLNPSIQKKVFCVRFRGRDGSVMERYLIVNTNGEVWLYNEQTSSLSKYAYVGSDACGALLRAATGEERFLIAGRNAGVFFTADDAFVPTGKTGLTSVFCVCKNRLFMLLKNGYIAYSDPLTPWDLTNSIDNGGYVKLPAEYGAPIALTAAGEYVYVIFRQVIMRLTVKGSGRDFCLEKIAYGGAKVLYGSVCALPDGVVFLAQDGVWTVRDREAKRLCEGLAVFTPSQEYESNAAVYRDKYFLRYYNENGAPVSLAINLDGGNWSYCFDLPMLSEGFDAPVFVNVQTLFRLGSAYLPGRVKSVFQSVDTDFGIRGRKTLRRLRFSGDGCVVAYIYCDGRSVKRIVEFSGGQASVDLCARGELFSFTFEIKQDTVLRSMSAELEA